MVSLVRLVNRREMVLRAKVLSNMWQHIDRGSDSLTGRIESL